MKKPKTTPPTKKNSGKKRGPARRRKNPDISKKLIRSAITAGGVVGGGYLSPAFGDLLGKATGSIVNPKARSAAELGAIALGCFALDEAMDSKALKSSDAKMGVYGFGCALMGQPAGTAAARLIGKRPRFNEAASEEDVVEPSADDAATDDQNAEGMGRSRRRRVRGRGTAGMLEYERQDVQHALAAARRARSTAGAIDYSPPMDGF